MLHFRFTTHPQTRGSVQCYLHVFSIVQYVFVIHSTCYFFATVISSGKYIRFGLRIDTRTERTMV